MHTIAPSAGANPCGGTDWCATPIGQPSKADAMPAPTLEAIAAAQDRIEQRQAAYEIVAHRILGCLEVHNEKLDVLLAAAEPPSGPSPVQEVLTDILAAMQQQAAALEALPNGIVQALREDDAADLTDEDMDIEGAGAWDRKA